MDLQRLLTWMAEREAQLSVEWRPPDRLVFHLAGYRKGGSVDDRHQSRLVSELTVARRAADLDVSQSLLSSTLEKMVAAIEELEVKIANGDKAEAHGWGKRPGAAEVAADDDCPDPDHQV